VVLSSVQGVWTTYAGGISNLASPGTSGVGTYLPTQSPTNLFDSNLNTIYSSRGNSSYGNNTYAGLNTGFYVTVAQCQPVLTGFLFGHVYNYPEREPLIVLVEGTNCNNLTTCTNWTLLYNGSSGLDIEASNSSYGYYMSITNINIYTSYRFLITAKRSYSPYVSYSEVELFGYSNQTSTSQSGTSSNLKHFFCDRSCFFSYTKTVSK
jgi:hypothetical protein